MKKLLTVIAGMLLAPAAMAGHYEFIPYYGNNPDLFCRYGVPEDCWKPKDPQRGTYRVVDHKCFKAASAKLYQRVCSSGGNPAVPLDRANARDPADASPGL